MGKNKITISSIFRLAVFIFSIMVSIYMVYNNNNDGYKYYFLVPFLFGILFFTVKEISNNLNRLGMFVFNLIIIVKYLLMPLVNCIANYHVWRGVAPGVESTRIGVALTIYEMIMVFLIIFLYAKKFYIKNYKCKKSFLLKYSEKKFIYTIFIFIGIGLIILFPQFIHDYRFVFSSKELNLVEIEIPNSGISRLIIEFSKICVSIIVINECKKLYDKKPLFRYVLISIFVIIINLLFSSGMSRWTLAVPGIIFTFMMVELFPNDKKKILLILGGIVVLTVYVLSIKKAFGVDSQIKTNNDIYRLADTLQMYFSGPKNIGISIEAKKLISNSGILNIKALFNDLFFSAAGLSNLTDYSNTTISIFNYRYYFSYISQDQIIPIIGQGFMYFGYILSPIFTCICTYLMMAVDRKIYETTDIILYYVYGYIVIWLARSMMLNITIIFSQVFNTGIIFLTIYILNKHIVLKKKQSSL